jgi:hypothetical protein
VANEHIQRRLAAVLAADVAGYSRLMGTDEVGTLEALKSHRREVVDPAIASHRGRIVKTTGDGMLVEFASAVDAVTCAMAVQDQMAAAQEMPRWIATWGSMLVAAAYLEREPEMREAKQRMLEILPSYSVAVARRQRAFRDKWIHDKLENALRLAGFSES